MKKLLIFALALGSLTAFSQDNVQGNKKDLMKRISERPTPEQHAEMQTKRLTLNLDLDKTQQVKVQEILLNNYKDFDNPYKKREMKNLSAEEKHSIKVERMDGVIALKEKMKDILNAEQYAKYSQMQERRIKRIQKNRRKRR